MKAKIRKLLTFLEETRLEMGQTVEPPTRRAAAVAVIENPFAGRYVEDLSELIDIGEELGELFGKPRGDGARDRRPARGKLRQGCRRRRERRARTCSGNPASEARGARSQSSRYRRGVDPLVEEARRTRVTLDVPLGHKDAAFVRSHFDGMEVRVADAPRANEIMVAVAVTDSGRPLPRVGGLKKDEIKGVDGLR